MKAWFAGFVACWVIAAAGLAAVEWWGLSPIERLTLRPELEAELAGSVPNPPVFGHPLLHFQIAAPWTDPDRYVRWHTLPADVVSEALHTVFPVPVLMLAARITIIAAFQAGVAAGVLWAAIQGACGGSGGTPVVPLGRSPGDR